MRAAGLSMRREGKTAGEIAMPGPVFAAPGPAGPGMKRSLAFRVLGSSLALLDVARDAHQFFRGDVRLRDREIAITGFHVEPAGPDVVDLDFQR